MPRRAGETILVDGVDIKRSARTLRSLAEDPQWEPPKNLDEALGVIARLLGFPTLHALNATVARAPGSDDVHPTTSADGQVDYPTRLRALVRDEATSFTLRKRLVEDESRDQFVALQEAETLLAVQQQRFSEATPVGAVKVPSEAGVEEVGVAALRRLYKVAIGDSGQCRYIARFLLSLYNGSRFPFDLTDLRAIDTALYEDCVRVLNMDARLTKREIHLYFENGSEKWEALADDWRVLDVYRLREVAKSLAERVGFTGPAGQDAAVLLEMLNR